MRRMAGNVLIVLAALGVAGTVALAGASIVEMHRTYPTSDRHAAAEGGLLLAGALLALDTILFLTGRSLRQPRADRTPEVLKARRRGRLAPLVLYLGVSIGIGLLAGLGHEILPHLGPLALLIWQPTFLAQILFSGILGLRLEDGMARQAVLVVLSLLYFTAFFYPIYSMVVMDRAVEVVRYRRMKAVTILFAIIHSLIALALVAISRA